MIEWDTTSERPDRPRIFGIGLNKTGTSSLHQALTILGFRSLHNGGPEVHDAVQAAIDGGVPLLTNLDQKYDAFSDIGLLSRRFRLLAEQYPGSKFVFTVRPVESWIDSRRRHVERNVARREAGEYDGTFLAVDEDKWMREWNEQVDRVRAYFTGRDDFLEVDIAAAPGWGSLCRLLGCPIPAAPFPWANRDNSIVSRRERLSRRAARWVNLRRRQEAH